MLEKQRSDTEQHFNACALNHVMCVEDDPDIRAILELSLSMIGQMRTSSCESGEEALSRVGNLQPDLILLDMMMPGLNGVETLKALRKDPHACTIPIIFMTAKAQKHDLEAYKSVGALAVLTKPFDPMTLAEKVRTLYEDRQN